MHRQIFSGPLKISQLGEVRGLCLGGIALARQRRVRAALPVGSYLDIKGHLDIKQVLVLPQVPSHLIFGVSQVILQLPDGVLQRQGHSGAHFVAGTSPTGFLLCLSQTHRNCNGNLVCNGTSHQQLGTMKSHANRDEEAGRAPGMTCKCGRWWEDLYTDVFLWFPICSKVCEMGGGGE